MVWGSWYVDGFSLRKNGWYYVVVMHSCSFFPSQFHSMANFIHMFMYYVHIEYIFRRSNNIGQLRWPTDFGKKTNNNSSVPFHFWLTSSLKNRDDLCVNAMHFILMVCVTCLLRTYFIYCRRKFTELPNNAIYISILWHSGTFISKWKMKN